MAEGGIAQTLLLSTAIEAQPFTTAQREIASAVGRMAIRGLYRELMLTPKPGLVSPIDSGSHSDMDVHTFMRSLYSLRHYFPAAARLGQSTPRFAALCPLGVSAEARMLSSTAGINTHRGAIFNLGLLCAAAGCLWRRGRAWTATNLTQTVVGLWGADILAAGRKQVVNERAMDVSHGVWVARRHGVGGARAEAASGFPAAIHWGLPAYRDVLADTGDSQRAGVQALFALIAKLEDTNLLWRGGAEGLAFAQQSAIDFLEAGGARRADWQARAETVHRAFVARRLSPGGAADLLGVTLFLHECERQEMGCA